jgi:4-amino-4-deoxy-L-arabinose transferase-like glycosyltransferase
VLAPRLKQLSVVVFVAAIVMLTNLGGPRLWDRDEPRNAGCAREMLARGDWVVPTFNGSLRTAKPVLLYWAIMSAYSIFGVSEFAARLPSALCAIGTVVCVYLMGRRLFSPQAGVWAGIALATSLMFGVAGRAATPDSVLIFCTTLALTIFVMGTFRPRFETTPLDAPPQLHSFGDYFPQHWPTAAVMYAVMGLAVLAKGPVGLVLPTAVIGMTLLILRLTASRPEPWTLGSTLRSIVRPFEPLHFLTTCWTMRPLTAIFAAAAIALPWYWAVGVATEGEFLQRFFWTENVMRAAGVAMEGHRGNILYYPIAVLVGFFPWSLFAAPLVIDLALQLRRKDNFNPGYVLATCWVVIYVVAFSLARTKLPSYVTPCYPALALLAGSYVDRFSRDATVVAGRWLWLAFGCLAAAGAGVAIAIPLVAPKYLPGEEWLGLIGLAPLAGGVICLGLNSVKNYRAAAGVFGATATAFATLIFALGGQQVDRHQTSNVILDAIDANSHDPRIASYKILEPSWVFYGGRPITELPVQPDQVASYLAGESDPFVITTASRLPELQGVLPPDVTIVARTKRFLKTDELVLLSRGRQPLDRTVETVGVDHILRWSR